MYKILLDENIPMEVYNYFQSLYEVDKVGIDYPYGISDEEIINILNTCKYQIFVTYDKDFGEMLFYKSYFLDCNRLSIILLRGNVGIFKEKFDIVLEKVKNGKFFVVFKNSKIKLVNLNG